jgi:hypothetical protein
MEIYVQRVLAFSFFSRMKATKLIKKIHSFLSPFGMVHEVFNDFFVAVRNEQSAMNSMRFNFEDELSLSTDDDNNQHEGKRFCSPMALLLITNVLWRNFHHHLHPR